MGGCTFEFVSCIITVQSAAWSEGLTGPFVDGAFGRLQRMRLQGVPALITPQWSLDTGFAFPTWLSEHEADAADAMARSRSRIAVIDLPPGVSVDQHANFKGHAQRRHTRIAALGEALPKHRIKQVRKAERLGLVFEPCADDLHRMVDLHQGARKRKGIASDGGALTRLLASLAGDDAVQSHFVCNARGERIAGGIFLRTAADRVVYAFGGADRSSESGLATVLLLHGAMDMARNAGVSRFDFGGSQDAGVDRFYAEFGAEAVTKWRRVIVSPAWKGYWAWRRPDLMVASPVSGPK